MAALLGCQGIVAALCDRERTGRGRALETSLFLGAMALQGDVLRGIATGREEGRRYGRPVWSALDQPIPTADGHLVVTPGVAARRRLFALFGIEPNAPPAEKQLCAALAERPARDWEAELVAGGVPAVRVREDLAALPMDPAVAPLLESAGGCWVPAAPWRFTV
jgi:formyl-CoA transferase